MKRVVVVCLAIAVLSSPAISANAAGRPGPAASRSVSGSTVIAQGEVSAQKVKRYYVTVTAIGDEARRAGSDASCSSKDFSAGQKGKITGKVGKSWKTLGHGTLDTCKLRTGASIPGIGAVASPTFLLSMYKVPLQKKMKLIIGKHSWPLTYQDFVDYGLDLDVTVDGDISGPPSSDTGGGSSFGF